jgi:hypothetical protein
LNYLAAMLALGICVQCNYIILNENMHSADARLCNIILTFKDTFLENSKSTLLA